MSLGNMDAALKALERYEMIGRELGDQKEVALALGQRAAFHCGLYGDLEKGLLLYREMEQVCRVSGDKQGLKDALHGQGSILLERGEINWSHPIVVEYEQLKLELASGPT